MDGRHELFECDATTAIEAIESGPIRELLINDCDQVPQALALLDGRAELETLDLSLAVNDGTQAVVDALAGLSLPGLRTLRLSTERTPVALARAPFWRKLEAFEATIDAADEAALQALFVDESPPALAKLDLVLGDFEDLARVLLASPMLSSLRILRTVALTPSLASLLERAQRLEELAVVGPGAWPERPSPAIRALTVHGKVGDEGLAALVRAFPKVRSLNAHDVGATATGAKAIGALRGLDELWLSFNALGDAGAKAIAPALDGVRKLHLHFAGIGEAGLASLAPKLGAVEVLHLNGNRIGPKGAALLASTPMPALSQLWINGCAIDAKGARALAASPNLAKLTHFDVDGREIGPKGVAAFAESPYLPAAMRARFGR